MSTFEVYIDFQDGGGEQDYSAYLRDGMIKNGRASSDDFHCAQSSVSFSLVYEATLLNKLLSTTEKMLVRIVKNSVNWFVGFIPPTISLESDGTVKTIQLEALDFTDLLKKKISDTDFDTIAWDNHKIFDSADKPNSICHKLLYLAGFTDTDIDVSESITDTVEVFVPSEDNYYDVLNTLLWEYGWTLRFDEAGKFHPWNWARTTVIKDYDLDETTAIVPLKIEKEEVNYEGAEVIWYELATRDDTLVFKENLPIDNTTGDLTGQIIIHQTYWPIEANVRDVYQSYSDAAIIYFTSKNAQGEKDFSSIVKTVNHTLDTIYDTGIVVSSASYGNLKAKVAFFNSDPVDDTLRLYAFNIRADVTYRSGERTSTKENISGTTKLWEYDSRYLFSKTDADRLSCAMAEIARGNAFNYQVDSEVDYPVGSVIELSDPGTGITQLCYIISKTEDVTDEIFSYKLIGIAVITIAGTGDSGSVFPASPEASSEQSALQILNRPTYNEVQDGYTEGGGTVIPTVPSLIVHPVATKALYILVDRQLNLTNFDHYEIQVSADDGGGSPDGNWYSLEQNGTDWKDAPDPAYTEFEVESFTHVGIPHEGQIDIPIGRTLHYRCRRVTKASVKSAWSATNFATTNTVDNGDIAAGSVYANSLIAGLLNAMVAEIQNYIQIGGAGFVGKTYGDTNGYQECGLSGLVENSDTGLTNGTYYFKITVDGGSQIEYSVTMDSVFTYDRLILFMNNASSGVTWELVNGDLRCTSKSTGLDSSIALAAGTTGTDLFASLDGFSAFDTAVDGSSVVFEHGSSRARIYQDEILIEFWNGVDWNTWMKMGGRSNDRLSPFYQGQGLIPVSGAGEIAVLDFGEIIPSAISTELYRFDNSFQNQSGFDPWTVKTGMGFDSTDKLFGTHSLKGTVNSSILSNDSSGQLWTQEKYVDFWHKSIESDRREKTLFQIGVNGDYINPVKESVDSTWFSGSAQVYYDICKLSDLKFVVVLRDGTGNISASVGVRGLDGSVTKGASASVAVLSNSGLWPKVIALSEDTIIVSYFDGSSNWAYVKCGKISGTTINFGASKQIEYNVSLNLSYMGKVGPDKFVVPTDSYGLRIGVVSNDNEITMGGSNIIGYYAARQNLRFVYVEEDLFIFCSGTSYKLFSVDGYSIILEDTETFMAGDGDFVCITKYRDNIFIGVSFRDGNKRLYSFRLTVSGGNTLTGSDLVSWGSTNSFLYSFEYGGRDEIDNRDIFYIALYHTIDASACVERYYLEDGDTLLRSFQSRRFIMTSSYRECLMLVFSPWHYMLFWKDTPAAPNSIKFAQAAQNGYSYLRFGRRNNVINDRTEYFVEFGECENTTPQFNLMKYAWQYSGAEVWRHFSFNFDQSSNMFYVTVNGESASIDVSSVSLNTSALLTRFFLDLNENIDDLLLDYSSYSLTYLDSIEHYRKFVRWAIEYDFEKDIILSGKDGGSVHIASLLSIVDALITGEVSSQKNKTPQEGDFRFLIDAQNETAGFDLYKSSSWENKVLLGGKIGGIPNEMIKSEGLYNRNAVPTNLERFPFGEFIKWDFENNLEDQRGLSWQGSSNVGYDSIHKKFGSYSLTSSGTGVAGTVQCVNYYFTGESLTVAFWFRDIASPVNFTVCQLESSVNGFRVQTADGGVQFRCIKDGDSNFINIYNDDITNGEFHFIYFSYDSISDVFSAGVDDVFEANSSLSGTWPGTPVLCDFYFTVSQDGGHFVNLDEVVFSPYVGDIKLLREHYTNNLPYDDNISKKDVSIIVPEGGNFKSVIDHNDDYYRMGQLYWCNLSGETGWRIFGNLPTTPTLVDWSEDVPFGVRGLWIRGQFIKTSGIQYCNPAFRPYGSSVTNTYDLVDFYQYRSDYSGNDTRWDFYFAVRTDAFGRFEYWSGTSVPQLAMSPRGFFI